MFRWGSTGPVLVIFETFGLSSKRHSRLLKTVCTVLDTEPSAPLTPNLLSDPRSLSEGRPNALKVTRSSPAASTDPFYLLTRDKMNGSCVEDLRLGPGGSLHPLFVQKNLWEEAEPLCGVHDGQQKKPKSSVTVTWV